MNSICSYLPSLLKLPAIFQEPLSTSKMTCIALSALALSATVFIAPSYISAALIVKSISVLTGSLSLIALFHAALSDRRPSAPSPCTKSVSTQTEPPQQLETEDRKEIEKLQSEVKKIRTELETTQKKLKETEDDLTTTQFELKNTKQTLENVQTDLQQSQNSSSKEEIEKLKKKQRELLGQTKDELTKYQQTAKRLNEELTKVRQDLQQKENIFSKTKSDLTNTKEELALATLRLEEVNRQLTDSQAEIKKLSQKNQANQIKENPKTPLQLTTQTEQTESKTESQNQAVPSPSKKVEIIKPPTQSKKIPYPIYLTFYDFTSEAPEVNVFKKRLLEKYATVEVKDIKQINENNKPNTPYSLLYLQSDPTGSRPCWSSSGPILTGLQSKWQTPIHVFLFNRKEMEMKKNCPPDHPSGWTQDAEGKIVPHVFYIYTGEGTAKDEFEEFLRFIN